MSENTPAPAAAPTTPPPAPPVPVDLSQGGWGDDDLDLKRPFIFAGATYTVLKIRVPSGRDLEAYYAASDRTLRALALRLLTVDEKVLDAMHASDYARLIGRVGEYAAGVR